MKQVAPISLAERLEHGFLDVEELMALAKRGRTAFYADVQAGFVTLEKHGRFTRIRGPVAQAYLERLHEIPLRTKSKAA